MFTWALQDYSATKNIQNKPENKFECRKGNS